MNINERPVAAEEGADNNFAITCMRQCKNGQLHARKFRNEITRPQLYRDLLVQQLRHLLHTD